jgi:hypothetical protein
MKKTDHPYRYLSDKAFWRRSVASLAMADVDPVGTFDLKIDSHTRVATAGSCFAQHIARHLRESGFNFYVAEPGHPIIPEQIRSAHNYGTYSARYGNIYTALQLRQLVQRVRGGFAPAETPWVDPDGSVRDPFRPTVQPGNFISVAEMEVDRRKHLQAVKTMFETLDVFVFTLGLTECWRSREDGAVFPLCPGVEGGVFDESRYVFHNQTVGEVISDMDEVIAYLKQVNPFAHVILTVSPVPLMATAVEGEHVLTATTYSKSVLRVAAQSLSTSHSNVHYFPSYEVITGAYNRGRYFADDLRNVTEEGVAHVMRLFLKHVAGAEPANVSREQGNEKVRSFERKVAAFVEVECDEVALDQSDKAVSSST